MAAEEDPRGGMRMRKCPYCHRDFHFRDRKGPVRTPRVLDCPWCAKRWRECDYGTDHGIHRIVEEVGLDVPLTATTGKDEVAESDSEARSV